MTKPIGLTELGATSLMVETGEQNMTQKIEKTLEIHLAEQREAIAKQVEAMRCECDPVDDSLKCVEENFLYDEIAKEIRKG